LFSADVWGGYVRYCLLPPDKCKYLSLPVLTGSNLSARAACAFPNNVLTNLGIRVTIQCLIYYSQRLSVFPGPSKFLQN
jgi:hypothetical protein